MAGWAGVAARGADADAASAARGEPAPDPRSDDPDEYPEVADEVDSQAPSTDEEEAGVFDQIERDGAA